MKAPAKSSGSSSPAVSTPAPSAAPDPGRKPGEHGGLDLFSLLAEHEHEQVSVYYDPSTGYRGIIAIHSTVLGPALGGTRSEEHTSELQSQSNLVCRLLLEKKKKKRCSDEDQPRAGAERSHPSSLRVRHCAAIRASGSNSEPNLPASGRAMLSQGHHRALRH